MKALSDCHAFLFEPDAERFDRVDEWILRKFDALNYVRHKEEDQ